MTSWHGKSAFLAFCEWNPQVDSPHKRTAIRGFIVSLLLASTFCVFDGKTCINPIWQLNCDHSLSKCWKFVRAISNDSAWSLWTYPKPLIALIGNKDYDCDQHRSCGWPKASTHRGSDKMIAILKTFSCVNMPNISEIFVSSSTSLRMLCVSHTGWNHSPDYLVRVINHNTHHGTLYSSHHDIRLCWLIIHSKYVVCLSAANIQRSCYKYTFIRKQNQIWYHITAIRGLGWWWVIDVRWKGFLTRPGVYRRE